MNLSEFTATVRSTLNVGTKLDDLIPGAIRQAARKIEQNFNFRYMLVAELGFFVPNTFTYNVGTASTVVKSFKRVYTYESASDYSQIYPLIQVDAQDFDHSDSRRPRFFFPRGDRSVVIGDNPDVIYTVGYEYFAYSTWPTADDGTHWLITNAETALLHRAIELLSVPLRDAELKASAAQEATVAESLLIRSDEDLVVSGPQENIMQYRGEV